MPQQIKKLEKLAAACSNLAHSKEELLQFHTRLDSIDGEIEAFKRTADPDSEADATTLGKLYARRDLLPGAIERREQAIEQLIQAVIEAWRSDTLGCQQYILDVHTSAVRQVADIFRPFCAPVSAGTLGEQEAEQFARELFVVQKLVQTSPAWAESGFHKNAKEGLQHDRAADMALTLWREFELAQANYQAALRSIEAKLPKA